MSTSSPSALAALSIRRRQRLTPTLMFGATTSGTCCASALQGVSLGDVEPGRADHRRARPVCALLEVGEHARRVAEVDEDVEGPEVRGDHRRCAPSLPPRLRRRRRRHRRAGDPITSRAPPSSRSSASASAWITVRPMRPCRAGNGNPETAHPANAFEEALYRVEPRRGLGVMGAPAAAKGLVELAQQLLLPVAERDRSLHFDLADEVADTLPAYRLDALSTEAERGVPSASPAAP